MGAFDILSQLRGPEIDIRMMGDAARAGTAVGEATPTKTTARIRGAIKGYQEGIKAVNDTLQTVKLGQEIAYLPEKLKLEQQQAQATLRNTEANAEINTIQANIARDTQELTLQETKDSLLAKQEKAQSDLQIYKAEQDFFERYNVMSVEEQNRFAIAPENSGLLTRSPAMQKAVAERLLGSGGKGLTPEEYRNQKETFGKQEIADKYNRDILPSYYKMKDAADAAFNADPLTSEIMATHPNLAVESVMPDIEIVPTGTYTKNKNGTIKTDSRGKPIKNELPKDEIVRTYEAVNTKTNKFVVDRVTPESRKIYLDKIKADSVVSGAQQRNEEREFVRRLDEQDAVVSGATRQAQDKLRPPLVSLNQPAERAEASAAPYRTPSQSILELEPAVFGDVLPIVKQLSTQLKSGAGATDIDTTSLNLIKSISDNQYEEKPDLYKQADVDAYNVNVEKEIRKAFSTGMSRNNIFGRFSGLGVSEELIEDKIDAAKISSPRELYYVTNRQAISDRVTKLKAEILRKSAMQPQIRQNRVTLPQSNAGALTASTEE